MKINLTSLLCLVTHCILDAFVNPDGTVFSVKKSILAGTIRVPVDRLVPLVLLIIPPSLSATVRQDLEVFFIEF